MEREGKNTKKTPKKNPLFSSSQSDEPSSQLAYFCGFGAECQRGSGGRSEMRLIRAKRNVDMFYAVVGVLEDMPGTIKALEGYIPRWELERSVIGYYNYYLGTFPGGLCAIFW